MRGKSEQIERYSWKNWKRQVNKLKDTGEEIERYSEQIRLSEKIQGYELKDAYTWFKKKSEQIGRYSWKKGLPVIAIIKGQNGEKFAHFFFSFDV